jgi:uncharacterized protein (DUF2141 family)
VNKYITYIIAVFFVGLVSCAHELPLTGGDKDEKPPVAEKFEPANNSTLFASKKIIVYFDEFVKLKEPSKQILISPPGTEFEATEKGQSIQVTITSTLKPNTTYVINFGGSIIDNNEGNVLNDLVYTFSTGNVLDSLESTFLVLDAYTLKPRPGVKIMLYETDVDSLPLTTLPYYAGTSNESGKAVIDYMKPGTYKVFALEEENKDYLYDKPNEGIGFLNTTIQPGDSIPQKVYYFKEEVLNPKIQVSRMPSAGMVVFKFTGPVQKEQLNIITNNEVYDTSRFEFIGTKKDSAVYWFKPIIGKDTLKWVFSRIQGQKDTTKLYPKVINTYKNDQVTGAPAFKMISTVPADFDFYKKLEIEFSTPVDSFGTDAIIIKEEDKKIPFVFKAVNGTNRKFILDYTFKPSKNYTVYFPKKSVKGIFGNYIDSTTIVFKTSNEKTYKILTMNIRDPEIKTGGAIIQIIDALDNVLDEQKFTWADSNQVLFKNLRQGSYRVRLIYDVNNNGKWDTGNYADKKQPEKVVFFPYPIDIKPNFDYELEWRIMQ